MRGVGAALIAVAMLSTNAARASDKLVIAAPPAWVKPIAVPKDDGSSADAAVKLLLTDQQIDFEPDGVATYSEVVMRLQTPQGLAAGNISLPWNPETDTLTVHKLHIIRDGKVIDVLAGRSFTILRRETNLENAMLDGVLTANIQPEGLQVGDVIDLATTIKHADPALAGHEEHLAGEFGSVPVARVRISARWPTAMPIRWRETDDLPPLMKTQADGFTSVGLVADVMKPVVLPKGAPLRFQIARQADFTDYGDWAALSATMAPLYQQAAEVPTQGAVRKEIDRIAALSPDPKVRAQAALALVENQVRYVYLGLNDGGLKPAPAETTWSRRFGDCKGKTVLLAAILRGLGISADPVIVNATLGDGLDARLPMVALFNHMIVRATIAGRTYWLDGTRLGDHALDDLIVPSFHWGLPLVAKGSGLVPIMPEPLTRPMATTTIKLDASAGIDKAAAAHVEIVYRGDLATGTHLGLENLTADDRDRALRNFWREHDAFIEPKAVSANYDAASGEERLTMDGSATMDWTNGGYETDGTLVGYTANLTRDPGPHADAPYAVQYPSFIIDRETIVLPDGGKRFTLDAANLDRTVGGIEYKRRGDITNGVVTVERQARAIAPEFPASDAAAVQQALRVLGRTAIYVRPPVFRTSSEAATAGAGAPPTTAQGWIATGISLGKAGRTDDAYAAFGKALALDPKSVQAMIGLAALDAGRKTAQSLAEYDKALAIDPNSADALAGRGFVHGTLDQRDLAMADFNKALNINPLQYGALLGRGYYEKASGEARAAIVDFSVALQVNPSSAAAYAGRADAFLNFGDRQRALADADKAAALDPKTPDTYVLLANIYQREGATDKSLAQAAAMIAAMPDNGDAHVSAGVIYAHFHRTEDAMREYSRALAIRPSVEAYLNRADAWPHDDIVHRKADLDAARKLAPDNIYVLRADARLAEQQKDYATAIADRTAAIKQEPGGAAEIGRRGIDYARAGQQVLAAKDFAAARALAQNATTLNTLCWEKAAAGQALPTALDECDAAIAKSPGNGNIIDSRAFVLLRMGRNAEARAAYDRALALDPKLAPSLYGRGIVEARLGDKDRSKADEAAALVIDPGLPAAFAGYGIAK